MAPRTLRFFPPLAALVFAILAFVFSLLAITSKEWAVRHNYDPIDTPKNFVKPIYTLYRSPFIICGAVKVTVNNTSSVAPSSTSTTTTTTEAATSSSSTSTPTPTYQLNCQHYKPFGSNRTSCELQVAAKTDKAATIGDARLCQQIHYAGNFGIASTLFIGLGFLITGAMVIMTFLNTWRESASTGERWAREDDKGMAPSVTTEAAATQGRNLNARPSRVASYLNLILLLFLFIGFATGILSQYYGVVGFMENLPNQSDYASSVGVGASTETRVHGNHGPWFQGVGLSVYATCAWSFTAAAGTVASRTWRLPRWTMEI